MQEFPVYGFGITVSSPLPTMGHARSGTVQFVLKDNVSNTQDNLINELILCNCANVLQVLWF